MIFLMSTVRVSIIMIIFFGFINNVLLFELDFDMRLFFLSFFTGQVLLTVPSVERHQGHAFMFSPNCIKYAILILHELLSETESFRVSNESFITIPLSILFIFFFVDLFCLPYLWFFDCVCRVKHEISSLSSLLCLFFWAILLNIFCLEINLNILLMLVPSFGVSGIVLNTSLFPCLLKLQW